MAHNPRCRFSVMGELGLHIGVTSKSREQRIYSWTTVLSLNSPLQGPGNDTTNVHSQSSYLNPIKENPSQAC